MPDVQITTAEDEDGLNAWLHDGSAEGRPALYDFGLTVRPDQQYAWYRDAGTGPRRPGA
ncbi:hypothetical protein [Streptomyces sp. Rer75]|uniref:hypothetical protein n=1 Tax=unclassified Streptomyces TaxID=2593676 RepID=UPI00211DD4D6|nr:hypothetical protein [Streptomyces sp. Rer75]